MSSMQAVGLKRSPEDDSPHEFNPNNEVNNDDDDDDISLVSRSPSPEPRRRDIDTVSKYDEYVPGAEQEVITVETKIKNTNKGFAMLAKLGWVEGQPLGISGEGRTEPIPFHVKRDMTGLGKYNQDIRMIEETVSQRRELDSERQTRETEEQRRQREDAVARQAAVKSEITSTLKSFFCELCEKQFQTVAQYDEHTNSYAHHHKARFKDMQIAARANRPQEEIEKRKEKERKREEKELRKMAKAAGIKMAKPATATAHLAPAPVTESTVGAASTPAPAKSGGWATMGQSSSSSLLAGASGFRSSGWASVGMNSTAAPPATSLPSPPPPESADLPPNLVSLPPGARGPPAHTPTFRAAGWTTLDGAPTQITAPPPPPPSSQQVSSSSLSGGWSTVSLAPPKDSAFKAAPAPPSFTRGGWSSISSSAPSPAAPSQPPPPPPPDHVAMSAAAPPPPPPSLASSHPTTSALSPRPPAAAPSVPASSSTASSNKPATTGRSGWQQFQQKSGRRR